MSLIITNHKVKILNNFYYRYQHFQLFKQINQKTPPTLEKITFVHYLKDEHSKPVWDDTVTDYRFIAGGVRWTRTIFYEVSMAGMPDYLEPEWVRDTLEAASETRDDVVDTEFFSRELFSSPSLTNELVVSGDCKNTVGWDLLDPKIIEPIREKKVKYRF